MAKKIVLGGPKHCGKTSTGRVLAAQLGGDFTDLDEEIARRASQSVRSLYLAGKDLFQAAEADALLALFDDETEQTAEVIALGGGVIDNERAAGELTCRLNAGDALFVYLEVRAETAWRRIAAAAERTGELPVFLRTETPRETHRTLHEKRRDAYRSFVREAGSAAMLINADRHNCAQIARTIAAWYEGRGGRGR